jgi:hypothetical protein
MPLLTRAALESRKALTVATVDIPHLDTVALRMLSAAEAATLETFGDDAHARMFHLITLSLADETGTPLFSADQAKAVAELIPVKALKPLLDAILSHNGMGPESAEATVKN